MSKDKHTSEPWEHTGGHDGRFKGYIRSVSSRIGEYSICSVTLSRREWEANAKRIVACVNACEGIADPSVVPEMLETLKNILLFYGRDSLYCSSRVHAVWDEVRKSIAKAEGAQK